MTYRARTLSRAQRDVMAILDWIAHQRHAPQGAANWLEAYETAIQAIVRSPTSFGLAPEGEFFEREVRQVLFKTRRGRTYRALFTIEGDEVLILRVRGPGQPPLQPDEM